MLLQPLSWHECDPARAAWHPFKWEDFATFRLRWVSGADFFLEVPFTDIEGHDIGIGLSRRVSSRVFSFFFVFQLETPR